MLQLRPHTDPILRKPCDPVADPKHIDIRALAHEMIGTMTAARGAGLAAPQVGYPIRLFVMAGGLNDRRMPPYPSADHVFINPQIVSFGAEKTFRKEGCLSMPGVYFEVERYAEVDVHYHNLNGEFVDRRFYGVEAICVQHEIDHLDGIRHIDRLSRLKRERAEKEFKKQVELRAQIARRQAVSTAMPGLSPSPTAAHLHQ